MTTQSHSFTPFSVDPARTTPIAVSGARIARLIAQIFRFARGRLRLWKVRSEDRAFLAELQAVELTEMGITLDQRVREVKKPFWQE